MSEVEPSEADFYVESGSLAGHSFHAPQEIGMVLRMGREKVCEVHFSSDDSESRMVGRLHALVERRADGLYLIDKSSTNGTLLNSEPMAPETPVRLSEYGAQIQLGSPHGPTVTLRRRPRFGAPVNGPRTVLLRPLDANELGRLREENAALRKQNEDLQNAKRSHEAMLTTREKRIRELERKPPSGGAVPEAGIDSARIAAAKNSIESFAKTLAALDDVIQAGNIQVAADLVMTMMDALANLRTSIDRLADRSSS